MEPILGSGYFGRQAADRFGTRIYNMVTTSVVLCRSCAGDEFPMEGEVLSVRSI